MVTRDAAALVGLGLVSVGCGLAWLPLGLIVPGVLILAATVWGHVTGGETPEGDDAA